jgi:predicted homoserine dehydrogenase-like protein
VVIVDRALEKRRQAGNPIRVGMVGAGFMGRGIALQILSAVPGLRLAAIANRHLEGARQAYVEAGAAAEDLREVGTPAQLQAALRRGQWAITEDPLLLCQAEGLEAILEVTGAVEFGAQVAWAAIQHGKHFITLNAELDGTIGPLLKVYADRAGVIFTNADGDQPGVTLNLYRFVQGLGVTPVLCGNIKGLHDPYRNPTTQAAFAERWGQQPAMVTSFADGTKISFEQAIVANATGMRVARRGMYGPVVPAGTPLREAIKAYPEAELLKAPGIVDYLVGAEPAPGVFVLGIHPHPRQQHYLRLYKLGDGPLYCFYRPYHLCHFEVPSSVARAVLFGDATITPRGGPCVEVVAAAKVDLRAGQILDGMGGYFTYGLAENSPTARAENCLPIGLAEGGRLLRDIPRDQVLTLADVHLPDGRLCDRLWAEQRAHFEEAAVPVMGQAAP